MKFLNRNKLLRKNHFSSFNSFFEREEKYNCHNYSPLPVVINKGKGIHLWDVHGKQYIDCLSAYSAVNQGHLHPRIKKALIDQLEHLSLTSRAVFNDKLGYACEFLCKTFGYQKSILMNTGVEACDTSIKFARRWGYERKRIAKDQAWVMFMNGNFWGRSLAACASSDDPDRFHNFGPFNMNFKLVDYNNEDLIEHEFKKNPNYAAVMLEPIQGENGIVIPREDYLKNVRFLCDKYKVLMIMDEVQTGLGRTGALLCQDHSNIRADLVCLGKALSGGFLPISAVLGSNEVFDTIVPNSHGSTFGGNPLAAAVLIEAVSVLIDEKMIENSKNMGKYLLEGFIKELKHFPLITDIRGKGLFIAIEVIEDEHDYGKKLTYLLRDEGVISKNTHGNRIRFAPPLIISQKDCDLVIERTVKAFHNLKK